MRIHRPSLAIAILAFQGVSAISSSVKGGGLVKMDTTRQRQRERRREPSFCPSSPTRPLSGLTDRALLFVQLDMAAAVNPDLKRMVRSRQATRHPRHC